MSDRLESFFLRSATRHPDLPALRVAGETFSYARLRVLAETIAGAIQQDEPAGRDRSPSPTCGVLVGKTAPGYAAVLGALLAGRTYVPLNPKFPAQRNATMVALSGLDTLVVDGSARAALAELLPLCPRPLRVVFSDRFDPPTGSTPAGHRHIVPPDSIAPRSTGEVGAGAEHAYLLFTSGSTGVPKGVAIPHTCVGSYLDEVLRRYRPTPEDRFTQLFDFSFDLSVHDLFVCWAAGACLYAPPPEASILPVPYVRDNALTFWFSVPSLAVQTRRFKVAAGALPSLRWSLFCGEALPAHVAASWQELACHSAIENLYGPTEATIAITGYRFRGADAATGGLVPIGEPFEGQETCLLNPDLSPTPPGQMGELFLGGSQVAPSYWRNPETTARQFIERQVPGKNSRRWYRTGDLARVQEGVGLIFCGRKDAQVKIRGFRVELSEVEQAVRDSGGVEEVAVVPWPRSPDGTVLGVWAFGSGFSLTPLQLRQHCARLLPDYMVPSEFLELPALPRNVNGKTDYRRLEELCALQGGPPRPCAHVS